MRLKYTNSSALKRATTNMALSGVVAIKRCWTTCEGQQICYFSKANKQEDGKLEGEFQWKWAYCEQGSQVLFSNAFDRNVTTVGNRNG